MNQTAEQEFPDEVELDELDRFLRDHRGDNGLLLDGVHGLMTALAIGPEPALPDEWLPEVLQQPFADAAEGGRILSLLAKLNDAVGTEVNADDYEPILGELEPKPGERKVSAAGWCEGFSRGVDLRAGMWESRLAEDTELMELMGPIMALAVEEGILTADEEFEQLSNADYDTCLTQIPASVSALAHYWRVQPPSPRESSADGAAASMEFETTPGRRHGRWLH